ncbi:hypothetical protein L484_019330 [Morus notabilis]|uniref:Uncharacterized protein n=1 Tax=Morus notabilis TaxID=981085 RepID=W9QWP7_9ROSA|nr:hypothetical protein L484_019330 [Morus notabilis]
MIAGLRTAPRCPGAPRIGSHAPWRPYSSALTLSLSVVAFLNSHPMPASDAAWLVWRRGTQNFSNSTV